MSIRRREADVASEETQMGGKSGDFEVEEEKAMSSIKFTGMRDGQWGEMGTRGTRGPLRRRSMR